MRDVETCQRDIDAAVRVLRSDVFFNLFTETDFFRLTREYTIISRQLSKCIKYSRIQSFFVVVVVVVKNRIKSGGFEEEI